MSNILPVQVGASPFVIRPEDVEATCASRGFQILRSYLAASHGSQFCDEHDQCDADEQEEWLLHRDIIHALIMPIVQLFNRASSLAQAALVSDKPDDWELAFNDDARDAFLALHCFLEDEEDWCYTRGCPACVTSTALATESHIRMLIAAILLSETTDRPSPDSVALPSFSFLLACIRTAILEDPLWGEAFSEHLYIRAEQLSNGMKAIIQKCMELAVLVESPEASPVRSPTQTKFHNVLEGDGGIKVRASKLAKRQARLRQEEEAYIKRLAHQCWGAVALPKELRMRVKSGIPASHKRNHTWCL